MTKIHKHAYRLLLNTATLLTLYNGILYFASVNDFFFYTSIVASILLYFYLVYSFRNPEIEIINDELSIYSPANATIIGIEEVHDSEFFKHRRMKISLLISPFDIQINRIPISGAIIYSNYSEGNYLFTLRKKELFNIEKSTTVLQTSDNKTIMISQIGGYLAGRVHIFADEGMQLKQGDELGFVKFGSKIEVYLPLEASIKVQLNQKVNACSTVLARF